MRARRRDMDSQTLLEADKLEFAANPGTIGRMSRSSFADAKKPPQLPVTAGKKKSKGKPAFLKGGK